MSSVVYKRRSDGRYDKTIYDGFNRYPQEQIVSARVRWTDFAVYAFSLALRGCLWILLGLALLAYFGYCLPYWFQPVMSAPLICVGKH